MRRVPHNQSCVFILAAALAQLDQEARAAQVVADLVRINPGFSPSEYQRLAVYWKDARDRERVTTGLRKAGVRE